MRSTSATNKTPLGRPSQHTHGQLHRPSRIFNRHSSRSQLLLPRAQPTPQTTANSSPSHPVDGCALQTRGHLSTDGDGTAAGVRCWDSTSLVMTSSFSSALMIEFSSTRFSLPSRPTCPRRDACWAVGIFAPAHCSDLEQGECAPPSVFGSTGLRIVRPSLFITCGQCDASPSPRGSSVRCSFCIINCILLAYFCLSKQQQQH